MVRPRQFARPLSVIVRIVWLFGFFTVFYGLWAWFALGKKAGLAISLAIRSAGPFEDWLNKKPRFGLTADQSVAWVDQVTSFMFLAFLLWAISLSL